jgi:hypothetical protein
MDDRLGIKKTACTKKNECPAPMSQTDPPATGRPCLDQAGAPIKQRCGTALQFQAYLSNASAQNECHGSDAPLWPSSFSS